MYFCLGKIFAQKCWSQYLECYVSACPCPLPHKDKKNFGKARQKTGMFPVDHMHCILATKFARSFFFLNDVCIKTKNH